MAAFPRYNSCVMPPMARHSPMGPHSMTLGDVERSLVQGLWCQTLRLQGHLRDGNPVRVRVFDAVIGVLDLLCHILKDCDFLRWVIVCDAQHRRWKGEMQFDCLVIDGLDLDVHKPLAAHTQYVFCPVESFQRSIPIARGRVPYEQFAGLKPRLGGDT
jgi:hypothetical protein